MFVDGFPSQSDGFDSRSPLQYFSGVFGHFRPKSPQHPSIDSLAESGQFRPRLACLSWKWLAHRLASLPVVAGPLALRLARLVGSATLPASHAPGARPRWSLGHFVSLRSVRMCSTLACHLTVFALALLTTPVPSSAQGLPHCPTFDPYRMTRAEVEACLGRPVPWGDDRPLNPYNSYGQPLFTPVKVQAWANVLVGLPGLENDYGAYLTLENDTEANTAQVIVRGASGVIQRFVFLAPDQRIVERLNDWPELAGQLPIGVSVRVRWMKEGNAGIAMHRARDFGSMVQAVEGGGTK